jgi:hypothetical protein
LDLASSLAYLKPALVGKALLFRQDAQGARQKPPFR